MSNVDLDYGSFQNDIAVLPNLGTYRYENIFKLYQDTNGAYFYNILTSIYTPSDLDKNLYYHITLQRKIPWTVISYNEYQTIDLWWLICIVNGIYNPLIYPEIGSNLKIIRSEFIPFIINTINTQVIQ